MTEPQYFGVLDHVELTDLDLHGFGYLASFRGGLHIITFSARDLANPSTEPLGLFYVNGTRRYIWQDRFWADYDVPCGPLMAAVALKLRDVQDEEAALTLRRVLDILKEYKVDAGPTPQDHVDNPASRDRKFNRVLYEVNE